MRFRQNSMHIFFKNIRMFKLIIRIKVMKMRISDFKARLF